MRSKILSKRTLLIIAFLGLALSVVIVFVVALPNQEQTNVESLARLKIPSINVDAVVEYAGLTSDGEMAVPSGPDEVVWFNLGPRPGENGSAIISGHYGWKNDIPAVFDDLHKLRKGDKIFFEDGEGVNTTFVVRETRIYSKDEAAPDVFDLGDGKAHLNLITCSGAWDEEENTRSDRLVVFTDKE